MYCASESIPLSSSFLYKVNLKVNLLQVVARNFSFWVCQTVVLGRRNFKFFGWDLLENWYFGGLVKTESWLLFSRWGVVSGWQMLVGLFFNVVDVFTFFEIELWCWKTNALLKAWNNWFWNLVALDPVLICLSGYHFNILSRCHQSLRIACQLHHCGSSGSDCVQS